MPGYSTVTGENESTVSMGTGTSLFRKLVSVGSGFTITGWEFQFAYGGEATASATGLATGVAQPDLGLRIGLSYGASTFTPPALLANEDATSMLWYAAGVDEAQFLVVPASSTWQAQYAWRFRASSRYQFRLTAASDFCVQLGNNSPGTLPFTFTASVRVSYT
jgi:hypothetical protein